MENNATKSCFNPFSDPISYYSQLINICLYIIATVISFCGLFGRNVNEMLLHRNTNILLINHHIAVAINIVSFTLCYGYNVWILLWHFNDCTYIDTPYLLCALLRAPGSTGFAATHLSHTAILLERYFATVHASKYEYLNGNILVTCLVVVAWALALGYAGSIIYDQFGTTIPACLTLTTLENSSRVAVLFNALTGIDLIVLLLFYIILQWNRRLRRRLLLNNNTNLNTLSERYQIDENTRWSRVMLYCMCLFCLTYSIPVLLGAIIRNVPSLDKLRPWHVALQQTGGVLYAIAYPFLLRKAEFKIRHGRLVMITNKVANADETELRFANLNNGWQTKTTAKK